ncbi:MAG: hypothetical protein KAH44_00700, partial [Oricola sp.]|nr:hypothetical protein [Oricola sp.]
MGMTPPSGREEFTGFPEFYDAEIAPFLRRKEEARQNAVMQAGLIAIAGAVVAFAALRFLPFGSANLQAAAIIGVIALACAAWRVNRTRSD